MLAFIKALEFLMLWQGDQAQLYETLQALANTARAQKDKPPYAFLTKQAFSPTAMPSTLQEIS